ncbi:MAG: hypothetical protein HY537_10610 [Deltaproteobacteria bacterium]|nr:hypothetical protein [Deltaproteobacteria bacterium]
MSSESEKKLKSSSSDLERDCEREFRPVEVSQSGKAEMPFLAQAAQKSEGSFRVPSDVWESLMQDAAIQKQVQQWINERVNVRLQAETSPERDTLMVQARTEGFQKGLDECHAGIKSFERKMDEICAEVLKQKEHILHSHEEIWCRALSYLLMRFLVSKRFEIGPDIKEWLGQSVSAFTQSGKVLVYVNPNDHEVCRKYLEENSRQWEVIADPSLECGQIRCSCNTSGFFFDPIKESEKIQKWLAQHFPEPTDNSCH